MNKLDSKEDRLFKEYFEKMAVANKLHLMSFIFEFEREYYYSEFSKGKWSPPIKINKL